MSDYEQQATALRTNMEAQARQIAGNDELTTDARTRKIGEIWQDGEARLSALYQQHQQAQTSAAESARKEAFTPPSTDPARMASLRDAMDRAQRVASTGEPSALKSMLEQAEMTGDEDQAYAVFIAAERNMNTDVMAQYLEDRPDAARRYENYRAANRTDLTRTIKEGMAFAAPSRPSVGGFNSWFG